MEKCWENEDNKEREVGKESSREMNGECVDDVNEHNITRQGMEFLSSCPGVEVMSRD